MRMRPFFLYGILLVSTLIVKELQGFSSSSNCFGCRNNGNSCTRGTIDESTSASCTTTTTALSMALASPPPDHRRAFFSPSSTSSQFSRRPPRIRNVNTRTPGKSDANSSSSSAAAADRVKIKWQRAEKVERQLLLALEALQEARSLDSKEKQQQQQGSGARQQQSSSSSSSSNTVVSGLLFPSVRECNAALATFGDGGELLRALRMFMKMRKSALLAQHLELERGWSWPVPKPTLVTYSTIMSRANRSGKPRVALRMWKLMQKSPEFVFFSEKKVAAPPACASSFATTTTTTTLRFAGPNTTTTSTTATTIVPDTRAANILMNSFAKLADIESAQDLLNQMRFGNGTDVPQLEPNLVTYNTLLDACHKAGDLDAALNAMEQLKRQQGLVPDAWSYTSLIATVARKPSTVSGANDPSLAFSFLNEMKARKIPPNGMTYSALIDVCYRCKRCDLALQGLRIMLRQKASDQQTLSAARLETKGSSGSNNRQRPPTGKNKKKNNNTPTSTTTSTTSPSSSSSSSYMGKPENYCLSNEVGAWTAAINALGKEGRLHAAMRLFSAMPNFGVQPNTVTCGCLTDSLLKHGRTADALKILHYMEDNGIAPSEVMYTSLMSSAGNLVALENKNEKTKVPPKSYDNSNNNDDDATSSFPPSCSSIEVYTVLMKSLMEDRVREEARERLSREEIQEINAHSLMKVFLVFQEMKEAGAHPDLAAYNTLLRACARVGDISRAESVLQQLQEDSLEPNDTTWRQLIRAAGKSSQRCDSVVSTWKMAMDYSNDHLGSINSQIRSSQWIPSIETFSSMISALIRGAADPMLSSLEKRRLYQEVVLMYAKIIAGNKDDELGMHRVDASDLVEDSRAMLLILQAIVSLEHLTDGSLPNAMDEKSKLRRLAAQILDFEVLDGMAQKQRLSRSAFRSLSIAQSWLDDGSTTGYLRP